MTKILPPQHQLSASHQNSSQTLDLLSAMNGQDLAQQEQFYDQSSSRLSNIQRHQPQMQSQLQTQFMQRQPSRQFESFGNMQNMQNGDMFTSQEQGMRFNTSNRFDRSNGPMPGIPFGYDMNQAQTWNPNAFSSNSQFPPGYAATTRMKPTQARGRTALPNVRSFSSRWRRKPQPPGPPPGFEWLCYDGPPLPYLPGASRATDAYYSNPYYQAWLDNTQYNLSAGLGVTPIPLGQFRHVDEEDLDELIPTAIVIKNIPFAVRKEQLVELMTEMRLPLPYAFNYHFDNGVFRGLAFANFTSADETSLVIDALNHYELQGRRLRVEYKKMLPIQERERIEREKRERRGQLEEQHRPVGGQLQNHPSMSSLASHRPANTPSPIGHRQELPGTLLFPLPNEASFERTSAEEIYRVPAQDGPRLLPDRSRSGSFSLDPDREAWHEQDEFLKSWNTIMRPLFQLVNLGMPIDTITDLNDPETLSFYNDILLYKQSDREALIFPSSLTPTQRRVVHTLAHHMSLGHASRGNGEQRQVHVYRANRPSPPLNNMNATRSADQNNRGLNRAATIDFNEARAIEQPGNYAILRGQQSSGLLGVPDSPGAFGTNQNLRAAKSVADLRSYTPSPVATTSSFPQALANNASRYQDVLNHQASGGPFGAGREDGLINGFGGLSLGRNNNGGAAESPRRLRPMFSFSETENQSLSGPPPAGAIGSNRSVSNAPAYDAAVRNAAIPVRQPLGPSERGTAAFSRARQNGHQHKSSDELRNQPEIIVE